MRLILTSGLLLLAVHLAPALVIIDVGNPVVSTAQPSFNLLLDLDADGTSGDLILFVKFNNEIDLATHNGWQVYVDVAGSPRFPTRLLPGDLVDTGSAATSTSLFDGFTNGLNPASPWTGDTGGSAAYLAFTNGTEFAWVELDFVNTSSFSQATVLRHAYSTSANGTPIAVPEPSFAALLASVGAIALVFRKRRVAKTNSAKFTTFSENSSTRPLA